MKCLEFLSLVVAFTSFTYWTICVNGLPQQDFGEELLSNGQLSDATGKDFLTSIFMSSIEIYQSSYSVSVSNTKCIKM
jgi:hypothetical protein